MASEKKKQKRKRKKHTLSELKTMGQQLLTSRAHVNNLPLLLSCITPNSPPPHALESLLSLQSFFTPLIPNLPSSSKHPDADPDPEFIYLTWLRSKFDELTQCLIDLVSSSQSDGALREVVLDSIMEFVNVGNAGKFNTAVYHRLLRAIVRSELSVDDVVLDMLAEKYFNYVDVRYSLAVPSKSWLGLWRRKVRTLYTVMILIENKEVSQDVNDLVSRSSIELSIQKMYKLLACIQPLEAVEEKLEMWNESGISSQDKEGKYKKSNDNVLSSKNTAKKMKQKFTKAWISFLSLPLPLDVYKEVLVTLHQSVISHLSNPIMLCDFLTRSYDIGGIVRVMALSSLFILMTQHGLEYPNFYNKLYALLEPSVFMAKHRSKFFQLLGSCLKSSLLPAYLAAAFCKKLSRLALFAPPSGALVIIALVHNLLQRHPSISFLVHREIDPDTIAENNTPDGASEDLFEEKPGIDHFKNEENDPRDTNAMRSSLWEIDTLRHHYSPPVSRFALSLVNDLAVRSRLPEVAVSDFSSGSYVTIFGDEIRRRVKQVALAFYKTTPACLFSELDFPGWTFKDDHQDTSAKRKRVDSIQER
ncbi:protein NUCLEOLAR COMPLEX ASSOCIATED 4-like isoform X2 [Salvia hispanica]|uniref:protein NUCLEOLAR COMPLEX ASSOCIATED 4-like isoform X2 n=1 Tax=Salvia hispanica TaxID=49212 RepID=UPI0020098389|nr:protein NUCLEOLAR COMPLEX ASSOCIATED 4-like isoform X2 [Salvia hispanica]